MWPDCPYLPLEPGWEAEGERGCITLVRSADGLRLHHSGNFQTVKTREVLWTFEGHCHRLLGKAHAFAVAARLVSPYSTEFQSNDVVEIVRVALARGDVVGVRARGDLDAEGDPTTEQRRLVRAIESQTRARLTEGSRQYRLIAGRDLARLPDRNSYEVVPRSEAIRVLGAIAQAAQATAAALIGKARDGLSPDWRPPLAPNGLVLLRRVNAPHISAASHEPALTPSQLWGKQGKEDDDIVDWTIWIELDPDDSKADDDVVILLDEFYQEVMRKPLASCPRDGGGVLVTFEQINKNSRYTLIRDYGPNEGGGQDTLFIDGTPVGLDEKGRNEG